MPLLHRALVASSLSLAIAAPLFARDHGSGAITVAHLWARETAQGQPTGGGFMVITNKGKADDRLIGGTTPIAAEVQIHTVSMDGGIMRMRRLVDGLPIATGASVELRPGSYHLMFIGLKAPLQAGTTVPVTLQFQRAGQVRVEFTVQSMTANLGTGGMPAMDRDHAPR